MIEQYIHPAHAAWPLSSATGDRQPLIHIAPLASCAVCVVIPVRDESDTLEATLNALAFQTDLRGKPLNPATFEIVILANNCRDDSATVVRRFSTRHPELILHVAERDLPAGEAHVGMARRLLMDEAHRRLAWLGKPRGIIATTDGDTRVSPTWIAATVAEIDRGADAVGGRIVMHAPDLNVLSVAGRECHLRDVGYRSMVAEMQSRLDPIIHDPWPRHFQHFGASLAVTAETYLRAGRLPVKPWFEDVAFFHALMRVDARLRHSPAVQVTTSGRRTGRTGFGFAVQLSHWESLDLRHQPMCVESAQAIEARIIAKQQLRRIWQARRDGIVISPALVNSLAVDLAVDATVLHEVFRQPGPFGMLAERVERVQRESGMWRGRWPLVDTRDAIRDLRLRLDALREHQPSLSGSLIEIEPVEAGPATVQVP